MAKRPPIQLEQLDFGMILAAADDSNRPAAQPPRLPANLFEASDRLRLVLLAHHAAMVAGDMPRAIECRTEAQAILVHLNGGTIMGAFAGDNAPGSVLAHALDTLPGIQNTWGQVATYQVSAGGLPLRVKFRHSILGCSTLRFWPAFDVYPLGDVQAFPPGGFLAVLDSAFPVRPGFTPRSFAMAAIEWLQAEAPALARAA